LDLRRAPGHLDDAADDTLRDDHRHVRPEPVIGALVDGERTEVRGGAPADDSGSGGVERDIALELEQVLQSSRFLGQRPLLLERDPQLRDLRLERLVLLPDVLQVDVVLPGVLRAADGRGDDPVDLGEDPEHDRVEHGDAPPCLRLRRDQDDVRQDDQHEQPAGAAPNFEKGHRPELRAR
jgi:hypothetical protein